MDKTKKASKRDLRDAVGDDTPDTELPMGLQLTREVPYEDVEKDEDAKSNSYTPMETSRPDSPDEEAPGDRQADERAELEEIEPNLGRQRSR